MPKLSPMESKETRLMYGTGDYSISDLGDVFNVSGQRFTGRWQCNRHADLLFWWILHGARPLASRASEVDVQSALANIHTAIAIIIRFSERDTKPSGTRELPPTQAHLMSRF